MVLRENSVVNTNTIAITATLIKNLLRSFKNIETAINEIKNGKGIAMEEIVAEMEAKYNTDEKWRKKYRLV